MGLERISAVLQHVNSNYDIDLFQHLLKAAANIIGIEDEGQPSLRVVADHARSCCFLIADGVSQVMKDVVMYYVVLSAVLSVTVTSLAQQVRSSTKCCNH